MVTRIRKNARAHLYIEEHLEAKGLSFEDIGGRMGVSRTTVWRWAKEQWRLDPGKMDALATAIGLEGPIELFRPPQRPSIDAILAEAPQDIYDATLDLARRLAGRSR
jgi:transcriptional regulator with XRE-family HTH domain